MRAVRDVSLSVGRGEVYGFLGPNGAGKSTTIRMLIGLIAPTSGEARLFGEDLRRHPAVLRRVGWIENTSLIWFVPNNAVGRYLVSAFVAVVFAGEYGWNTWKLIVPHRRRGSLIAAKYALTILLFAIGYASLAAILTRSTIAALVIAIVATSVEQIVTSFGPQLYFNFPSIVWPLYHMLPGHHIGNLAEYIREGVALKRQFPGGHVVDLAWTTSLAILPAWLAALCGGAFAAFRRQDIN